MYMVYMVPGTEFPVFPVFFPLSKPDETNFANEQYYSLLFPEMVRFLMNLLIRGLFFCKQEGSGQRKEGDKQNNNRVNISSF